MRNHMDLMSIITYSLTLIYVQSFYQIIRKNVLTDLAERSSNGFCALAD